MIAILVPLLFGLSFLSGMLGLGVAFVAIPVLGLFGYQLEDVIQPWALFLNGLTATSGAIAFWRAGMVDRIEVLGPGCSNCLRLELEAAKAVQKAGIEAEIRKITDPREILRYGVLSTPGLVIDGVVASTGRIPSAEEIVGWLSAA